MTLEMMPQFLQLQISLTGRAGRLRRTDGRKTIGLAVVRIRPFDQPTILHHFSDETSHLGPIKVPSSFSHDDEHKPPTRRRVDCW